MVSLRQKVVDYLAGFGLDASEISADCSADGFTLVRPGADRTVVHPWPDGLDFGWLSSLIRAAQQEEGRQLDPRRGV